MTNEELQAAVARLTEANGASLALAPPTLAALEAGLLVYVRERAGLDGARWAIEVMAGEHDEDVKVWQRSPETTPADRAEYVICDFHRDCSVFGEVDPTGACYVAEQIDRWFTAHGGWTWHANALDLRIDMAWTIAYYTAAASVAAAVDRGPT